MSETQPDPPRPSRPMLLVAERQTPDPPPASLPPPPAAAAAPPAETQQFKAWRAGVMGAVNVIAAVLAVRLILLVATAGAIALAWLAAAEHDPYRLGALVAYTVSVVLPMVWLAGKR